MEQFVNFLSPNARQNATNINFKDDLSNINVKSVGLFGTKRQICDMLLKLRAADQEL